MRKHTPGPWYATNVDYPDLGTMQDDEAGTWTVSTTPDQAGWRHDGGFPGYGVSEANARLMACAPDLLEALEAYLGAQNAAQIRRAQGMAHKVIAKAKGE